MNAPFPFGFPAPLAFYAVLYVVTLVLHVLFMNYVLAGTVVLAGGLVRRWLRPVPAPADPVLQILKDWLPFALSAAITAGIGPLLFVQILYQREFYTANLLLFHRWMAILPVLIAAFYLLYLLKARRLEKSPAVKALIALLTAGCMLFVAGAWTENHLLSLDRGAWAGHYAAGALVHRDPMIAPRLLVWCFGALPTLSLLVGWQLLAGASGTDTARWPAAHRRLGRLALFGLAGAAASAAWTAGTGGLEFRAAAGGPLALPWLAAAVVGALLQGFVWLGPAVGRRLTTGALWLGSVGLLLTLTGGSIVREAIRLATFADARGANLAPLAGRALDASRTGGAPIFLVFAILSLLVVGWVLRTVARALREGRNS